MLAKWTPVGKILSFFLIRQKRVCFKFYFMFTAAEKLCYGHCKYVGLSIGDKKQF